MSIKNIIVAVAGCQKILWLSMVWMLNMLPATFAETIEVGGTLSGTINWTSENTYIATDNILLPSGSTLTIEAGTVIKFNQGRGLNVEGGKLLIQGNKTDSVYMIPNHTGNETWNWNGITISNIFFPGTIEVSHLHIRHSIRGIRGEGANHVLIENSLFQDIFYIGVAINNSSSWTVRNNRFENNFIGLEIFATGQGSQSSNNLIEHNIFNNFTTNISIQSNNHGFCYNNLIEGNILKNSGHGIWLFSSSQGTAARTMVQRNIIFNNGHENEGAGVYASMDSTFILQNIFWDNRTAVIFSSSADSYFHYNHVYENQAGIIFRNNSRIIEVANNTFTANKEYIARFLAQEDVLFTENNIFNNERDTALLMNLTPFNMDVSGNYWGTTDSLQIKGYLYDNSNDPALGELNYLPFLSQLNPEAPVSAPSGVFTQQTGQTVRISWVPNPEPAVVGYRIFYGEFSNYAFSDSTAMITDTVMSLNIPIDANIAVAAYLEQGTDTLSFFDLKSPYAFARQKPFAGNDSILCVTISYFEPTLVFVPQGLSEISWSSNGDGTFNDNQILIPRYFPGPQDLLNGEVTLTLQAASSEVILQDQVTLFLQPLPFAYAGTNTFISPDLSFFTVQAEAENFDALQWQTSGDGFFENPDSLQTIYYPGEDDILNGEVILFLTAFSLFCEEAEDSIILYIRPSHSLQGRVWQDNTPLPDHPVMAILMTGEKEDVPARFLTFSDNEGQFRFDALFEGDYTLYLPADTMDQSSFIPVYYAEQSRWQYATIIPLKGNTYEVDIRKRSAVTSLPQGTGTIAGFFELEGIPKSDKDVYCQPWFGMQEPDLCTEGLSNISVLLFSLSRQKIYAHTLTNSRGYFHFDNLPFGTYILEVEMAGYTSAVSEKLNISPQQNNIDNIEMRIHAEKKIEITVPPDKTVPADLRFYPNPAAERINIISGLFDDKQRLEITINDHSGRKWYRGNHYPAGLQLQINLSSIPSGMYIMQITNPVTGVQQSFLFRKK